MDLSFSPYMLQSASTLSAVSNRGEYPGILIRADGGYGCIHPWLELGDEPLDQQIEALRSGRSTALVEQALRCAAVDGAARREGRSLFTDPIPPSHWLIIEGDDPAQARAAGFHVAKLKVGRDPIRELAMAQEWAAAEFRIRLDCNESLTLESFLEFWFSLDRIRDSISVVEDPINWNPESWRVLREAGVAIAVDREVGARWTDGHCAVIKPAVTEWMPPAGSRIFVTSYMDHAIGQMWAAAEAARIAATGRWDLGTCGLLTHRCFEPDPFFERIQTDGARLLPPGGTGLGFDDLLEGLPWESL